MRSKGRSQITRESSITTLIIAVVLACSITFPPACAPTGGSLIWKKFSNPSSVADNAYGVAVDDTGVYVVGFDKKLGDNRWRVEKRELGDGSLIWRKTSNPSGGSDVAVDVAVDDTGVYIVGNDEKPGNKRWRVEKRELGDGSLIWVKGSNPSSLDDEAKGVAVDGTGVYIVGYDSTLGSVDTRWRIEKRDLSTGSLIWRKNSDPTSRYDDAYGVAVDGTDVYIVGHESIPGTAIDTRWRIEKRDTTGSILWVKVSDPSGGSEVARRVVVDGSGVYIVGFDRKPGNARWRIEKRDPADGSLTWAKGSNPSSLGDEAKGVAVDGSGVYIVGFDLNLGVANDRWRVEKRSLTDGSIIWKKFSNPSSSADQAHGVAVDSTGVYIAGFDMKAGTGNTRWRMEKRGL